MKASTTRKCRCLGNRRLASGAIVILAKGGRSVGSRGCKQCRLRYLGGGLYCLIRGGTGSSSFETGSAELDGTANEDPTCSSYGRTKHIGVRHDLVRDACETGKVRVVCVKTRTCSH